MIGWLFFPLFHRLNELVLPLPSRNFFEHLTFFIFRWFYLSLSKVGWRLSRSNSSLCHQRFGRKMTNNSFSRWSVAFITLWFYCLNLWLLMIWFCFIAIGTFFDSGRRCSPLWRRRCGGLVLYVADTTKNIVVWSSDVLEVSLFARRHYEMF